MVLTHLLSSSGEFLGAGSRDSPAADGSRGLLSPHLLLPSAGLGHHGQLC